MTFCFYSSHAITSDVSLPEAVKAAKFFLADGIILTGAATGDPASVSEFTGIFPILTYRNFYKTIVTKKKKNHAV